MELDDSVFPGGEVEPQTVCNESQRRNSVSGGSEIAPEQSVAPSGGNEEDSIKEDYLTLKVNAATRQLVNANVGDVLDEYVPSDSAIEVFERLDVLVCGRCQCVFHLRQELESHSKVCQGDDETVSGMAADGVGPPTEYAIAMVLWCNTIRSLLEKSGNTALLDQESLRKKIQTKWFRLSRRAKSTWLRAAKSLKELGETGKLVFDTPQQSSSQGRFQLSVNGGTPLVEIKEEVLEEWPRLGLEGEGCPEKTTDGDSTSPFLPPEVLDGGEASSSAPPSRCEDIGVNTDPVPLTLEAGTNMLEDEGNEEGKKSIWLRLFEENKVLTGRLDHLQKRQDRTMNEKDALSQEICSLRESEPLRFKKFRLECLELKEKNSQLSAEKVRYKDEATNCRKRMVDALAELDKAKKREVQLNSHLKSEMEEGKMRVERLQRRIQVLEQEKRNLQHKQQQHHHHPLGVDTSTLSQGFSKRKKINGLFIPGESGFAARKSTPSRVRFGRPPLSRTHNLSSPPQDRRRRQQIKEEANFSGEESRKLSPPQDRRKRQYGQVMIKEEASFSSEERECKKIRSSLESGKDESEFQREFERTMLTNKGNYTLSAINKTTMRGASWRKMERKVDSGHHHDVSVLQLGGKGGPLTLREAAAKMDVVAMNPLKKTKQALSQSLPLSWNDKKCPKTQKKCKEDGGDDNSKKEDLMKLPSGLSIVQVSTKNPLVIPPPGNGTLRKRNVVSVISPRPLGNAAKKLLPIVQGTGDEVGWERPMRQKPVSVSPNASTTEPIDAAKGKDVKSLAQILPHGFEMIKHVKTDGAIEYRVKKRPTTETSASSVANDEPSTTEAVYGASSHSSVVATTTQCQGQEEFVQQPVVDSAEETSSLEKDHQTTAPFKTELQSDSSETVDSAIAAAILPDPQETHETGYQHHVILEDNQEYLTLQIGGDEEPSGPHEELQQETYEGVKEAVQVVASEDENGQQPCVIAGNEGDIVDTSNKFLLVLPGGDMILTDLTPDQCAQLNIQINGEQTQQENSVAEAVDEQPLEAATTAETDTKTGLNTDEAADSAVKDTEERPVVESSTAEPSNDTSIPEPATQSSSTESAATEKISAETAQSAAPSEDDETNDKSKERSNGDETMTEETTNNT